MQVSTPIARLIVRSLCKQAAENATTITDLIDDLVGATWETIKTGGTITGTSSGGHSVSFSPPSQSSSISAQSLAETISWLADLIAIAESIGVLPEDMCAWLLLNMTKQSRYRDSFLGLEVTA